MQDLKEKQLKKLNKEFNKLNLEYIRIDKKMSTEKDIDNSSQMLEIIQNKMSKISSDIENIYDNI